MTHREKALLLIGEADELLDDAIAELYKSDTYDSIEQDVDYALAELKQVVRKLFDRHTVAQLRASLRAQGVAGY